MSVLPEGFQSVERWVSEWALDSTDLRLRKRGTATSDEIRAFHRDMVEIAPRALEHLSGKDIYALEAADEMLLKLILSLGHTAMAVEVQKTTHQPGVKYPHNIRVTHGLPVWG